MPSLFDKDTIQWTSDESTDLSALIKGLSEIKHNDIFTDSVYEIRSVKDEFIVATHTNTGKKAVGVFPVKNTSSCVEVPLEDGYYTDLISGDKTEVFRGLISCKGEPIIIIK